MLPLPEPDLGYGLQNLELVIWLNRLLFMSVWEGVLTITSPPVPFVLKFWGGVGFREHNSLFQVYN